MSDGLIQSVAVSPDGATLALADSAEGLFFFDARTFDQLGEPMDIPGIRSLTFSPDGRTLAYAADDEQNPHESPVGLVDPRDHVRLQSSTVGWDKPSRIMYTPDGSKLAVIASSGAGQ